MPIERTMLLGPLAIALTLSCCLAGCGTKDNGVDACGGSHHRSLRVLLPFDDEPVVDRVSTTQFELEGNALLSAENKWSDAREEDCDSGRALSLDGSGSFAVAPDADRFEPEAFSVAAWVYPTNLDDIRTIVAKGNTEDLPTGYLLKTDGGTVVLTLAGDGMEQEVLSRDPIITNRWQHLLGSFDGTRGKIYLDGALVADEPVFVPLLYGSEPFFVGHTPDRDHDFSGLIDDVRLYDEARE